MQDELANFNKRWHMRSQRDHDDTNELSMTVETDGEGVSCLRGGVDCFVSVEGKILRKCLTFVLCACAVCVCKIQEKGLTSVRGLVVVACR